MGEGVGEPLPLAKDTETDAPGESGGEGSAVGEGKPLGVGVGVTR